MTFKVQVHGFTFDARTAAMIAWAEAHAGFAFTIMQGSYNTGVAASAGTHNGGGAVDFSTKNLSPAKLNTMLGSLKDAGFAAWHRTAIAGVWPDHVHCIAINGPDLAPLAAAQVKSFLAGRNGMADNGVDKSYRPKPPVLFDMKLGRPVAKPVAAPKPTTRQIRCHRRCP